MSTPTIRAALERLVALSKQHAIASVWDGAFFNARAALKAAALGDGLAPRVLAMCKQRNWSLHWTSRGAYLHLEASELIEALRGKRGDPLAEAADVLLVLMSITENAGIDWSAVVQQTAATCSRLEGCDQYPGEERMDSPAALEAEPVGEGPSREQILSLANDRLGFVLSPEEEEDIIELVRAILDRWGRPAAPAAPKPGEVGELVEWLAMLRNGSRGVATHYDDRLARIITLLSQLSAPAPAVVPVAVAERLPGDGDCDAEGRCWQEEPGSSCESPGWDLVHRIRVIEYGHGRWLPFHAIPLPQPNEAHS